MVLRSRILKFRENARSMFITFGPETVAPGRRVNAGERRRGKERVDVEIAGDV
jgi:hypothetical protein